MHTKVILSKTANTPNIVLFYQAASPFSNFYYTEFSANSTNYTCSEQYFMQQKALHAGDSGAAREILTKSNPGQMKRIGRGLKMDKKMIESWNLISRKVMYQACLEKFSQNPEIRLFLLRTHGMKLAEAAPNDCIWGIGLDIHDERAKDIANWHGENRLGQVLEGVRDELWGKEEFRADREVVEKEDLKTRCWKLEHFK